MAIDLSLPGYINSDGSLYNPIPLYKDIIGNNLVNSVNDNTSVNNTNAKKLSKESEATTSKQDAVIIQALPGVSIQVLFEFPANDYQSSVYFLAKDIITVSYSVARSKIPVTLLGQSSFSGMAIGTKMIAGSIIKLFGRYDSISNYIKTFVAERWDNLDTGFKDDLSSVQSNITFKEFSDYMRDDLSPFNIHFIHTSELLLDSDTIGSGEESKTYAPRVSSIIGATIINNGKVFSVENLITEETMSFLAKTVIFDSDNIKPERANYNIMTGSQLLGLR